MRVTWLATLYFREKNNSNVKHSVLLEKWVQHADRIYTAGYSKGGGESDFLSATLAGPPELQSAV